MAACRLASKGRSLADSSYDSEVSSIKSFLSMQKPAHAPAISINPNDIEPVDFLAPRFLKKLKSKSVQRILEAHANVKELPQIDAKMKFIQAWQSLPEFGVSLFVIKFDGHKKEELLGVAHNRIMKMDLNTGDHLKTWRYNTVKVINNAGEEGVDEMRINLLSYYSSGMERELGDQVHDDPVPGGEHHLLVLVGGLQGGP